MPRLFPLKFRQMGVICEHFAIIGMATVVGGVPLFYDAANEHGLAMAGLNFPKNAYYAPIQDGRDNITPFEFIPWILGKCQNLSEARELLSRINLVDIPFSERLPLSPLHWMISDKNGSIVVESMSDGLHIYDNPAGVMTNNPPFPYQLFNLNNYRGLNVSNGENSFAEDIPLDTYCQGLGAIGLPGDVSSMSRFVRIAFNRAHAVCEKDESSSVSQFFHLLSSVEMNRGCCKTSSGEWDITIYTSCVNLQRGLYYYTTYGNSQITCVDMHHTELDSAELSRFPPVKELQIRREN